MPAAALCLPGSHWPPEASALASSPATPQGPYVGLTPQPTSPRGQERGDCPVCSAVVPLCVPCSSGNIFSPWSGCLTGTQAPRCACSGDWSLGKSSPGHREGARPSPLGDHSGALGIRYCIRRCSPGAQRPHRGSFEPRLWGPVGWWPFWAWVPPGPSVAPRHWPVWVPVCLGGAVGRLRAEPRAPRVPGEGKTPGCPPVPRLSWKPSCTSLIGRGPSLVGWPSTACG